LRTPARSCNGELGDLLTGRPGSERTLLQLEDANAFVVSLDPSARGFATTTCSGISCGWSCAARCPKKFALHRRAAAWFAEHGQVVEAIRRRPGGG
jgi:LuxR family maltose regulon positive regulatory protein